MNHLSPHSLVPQHTTSSLELESESEQHFRAFNERITISIQKLSRCHAVAFSMLMGQETTRFGAGPCIVGFFPACLGEPPDVLSGVCRGGSSRIDPNRIVRLHRLRGLRSLFSCFGLTSAGEPFSTPLGVLLRPRHNSYAETNPCDKKPPRVKGLSRRNYYAWDEVFGGYSALSHEVLS
jgi:hypothetical protein